MPSAEGSTGAPRGSRDVTGTESTGAFLSEAQRARVEVGFPDIWWRGQHFWALTMAAALFVFPGPERPTVDAALLVGLVPLVELFRRLPLSPRVASICTAVLHQLLIAVFLFVDPAVQAPAALGSLAAIAAAGAFAGVAAAILAATFAAVAFSIATIVGDATAVVTVPVIVMNGVAGPLVGVLATSYRRAIREAADAAEDRRQALEDLRLATRLERKLLADRLHDRPVQSLVSALFLVDRNADRSRVFIEQALTEIRNEIWTANPVVEAPDSEALAAATAERLAGAGVRGDLDLRAWEDVPPGLRPLVWRTIGEAITNLLKHGRATETSVRLTVDTGWVRVEVQNDGSSSGDPAGAGESGYGLRSLVREWEHFGGGLAGESRSGGGFTLRGWAPRETSERHHDVAGR